MIKKLDILILRSFIGPFIVTFFVTLFVLVMQFFWLYMDELIGKGLGIWMIIQLLAYMSTTLVPMALPLGILLASIMTFGNMGENFELVAIKSAGISLLRFMRPLFIFIAFIGVLAFFFNNSVIPVANLKALSLLHDLRSKPALNIRAGQFVNDIGNYSIRIGSKDQDGKTIHNVIIYDRTNGMGNTRVVLANAGEMIASPDKQYLIFKLYDGWRYDEEDNGGNYEQTRMHFKQWNKIFDLSSFKLTRTNEDLFKGAYQMMNVAQLKENIDSLQHYDATVTKNVSQFMAPYITAFSTKNDKKDLLDKIQKDSIPVQKYTGSFLQLVKDSLHLSVLTQATNNVRSISSLLSPTVSDKKIQHENYLKFNVEWHRKFTLSFACLLLFLIGAPLGAIIRKGGVGMPLVIAVSFFVVYHITSVTGEKLAKSGSLPPIVGMWMSTGMLLPIAFLLIQQARNDSQIFTKEWYLRAWGRIRKLFAGNKK